MKPCQSFIQSKLPPICGRLRSGKIKDRSLRQIPVLDIAYLESDSKYTLIHTTYGIVYDTDASLTTIEQDYSSAFLRISRSCMVNYLAIGKSTTALLHIPLLNIDLPVARRMRSSVRYNPLLEHVLKK